MYRTFNSIKILLNEKICYIYIVPVSYTHLFLKAYYHFRALQMYGPIPIIDQFMSSNIAKNEIPGRSHFDYCIKYIVDLLDEAKRVLPEQTTPDFYGRATSVICKALKARVLVLRCV